MKSDASAPAADDGQPVMEETIKCLIQVLYCGNMAVYLIFCFKFATGGVPMEKIVLNWDIQAIEDAERVTATYCFKSCNVNNN